jgi:hypothetical protein
MIRALGMRDGSPPCSEVEALAAEPVPALAGIAENLDMPPWAGMRAADCLLLGHATASQEHIVGWVGDPETKGLALLALKQLDEMPLDVSLSVATAALAGPHADLARARIAEVQTPEVRALAGVSR